MSLQQLLDQETARVIREGRQAKELLNNQVFSSILNELSSQYIVDITESQAHESKTREDRYLRIQVLKDIATTLTHRVALGERAEAEITATNDPDNEETYTP